MLYSGYLADQIGRADLTDCISIIPATPYIDIAYEMAGMMLITSRLDTLPNVSIDAVCEGIPTLCFDKTTGIAEILKDANLGVLRRAIFGL